MPVEIRNLSQNDIPECAKIFYEIFGPNGCGESWTPDTCLKQVEENSTHKEYCFVATEGEKIIALILAFPITREMNTDIFIDTLGVLSSFQGQHIGSRLLKKVSDLGKDNGAKYIRLLANKKFISYDWYASKGMKPSGWVELEQAI